ncbi:hypothetical protein FW778_03740 [Ginsengibacter hankyongi]|uniref:Uncharacterized protein n=1 Tax=Ginsengibacter hankyongi TaxID=2607284 RepID=A0A5J5IJD0_9BACT|nr:hypothetical protein [Ginsengibacter hankyongi]KAA9041160.1 hypothetical protein FW778_03740 [Ginsengibacter hankyongi]
MWHKEKQIVLLKFVGKPGSSFICFSLPINIFICLVKKVLVADDDFGIADVMLDLCMSGVDANVVCKELKVNDNF